MLSGPRQSSITFPFFNSVERGVGGSIFWKTPDTALYSTYVSTLCLYPSLYMKACCICCMLQEQRITKTSRKYGWSSSIKEPNFCVMPRRRLSARNGGDMDQITIKTPNPSFRLYWCLIEFIDWRYSQSFGVFDPSYKLAPLYLLSPPAPLLGMNKYSGMHLYSV